MLLRWCVVLRCFSSNACDGPDHMHTFFWSRSTRELHALNGVDDKTPRVRTLVCPTNEGFHVRTHRLETPQKNRNTDNCVNCQSVQIRRPRASVFSQTPSSFLTPATSRQHHFTEKYWDPKASSVHFPTKIEHGLEVSVAFPNLPWPDAPQFPNPVSDMAASRPKSY